MRRLFLPDVHAGRDAPGPLTAWAIVALLTVLHAAPFLITFIEGDFARDLDQAARIVEGAAWPMRGPVLAWTLNLGPVWYWLLALPLALTHSIAAAVAMVAMLSALQFPLAYRLGSAVAGRAYGLAFAVFLALPGLASLQGIWIAHPSLVPSAMLVVALCAWRAWTLGSPRWWIASMLASGLALHAHPTTLPVLALPLAAAASALRAGGRTRGGALALGIVALLMPFAPLAFDLAANAEALGRFSSNVSSDAARFSPARWAGAFSSIAWRAPDALAGAALAGQPGALPGFRLALAGLYVFALAGTVRAVAGGATAWRLPVLSALAACAATIAMIVAVRETTRFYMLYAALPPFAAWLAAATGALPSRAGRRVGWGIVPVACALGVSVAVSCAWMLRAVRGEIRVPYALSAPANLSVSVPRGYASLATLAPSDLDRIGARVCDAGRVRAFGELAGILDMLLNVPGRLACGASSRVELGGVGEGTPLFLVVADAVPPGTPHERLGAFALGRPGQVVAPTEPIPLADGASYPWRKACGPPVPVAYRFVTRGAGTLVVSNALPVTCPMTIRHIARDGADARSIERADSRIAPLPDGEATWDVGVDTGAPLAVQIFTIAAPSGGG